MSLIVAVYVPTGIALSGDSRTTGTITQQAIQAAGPHAGQPVTVQTSIVVSDAAEKIFLVFERFALGTFGEALVESRPIAHYIEQFELSLESAPTSTQQCAEVLLTYFQALNPALQSGFVVVGYDENEPHVLGIDVGLGTISRINVHPDDPALPGYGIVRGGDTAVVDRLLSDPQYNPPFDAMNLQDAVDYSRHLIRSSIDQMRFEPRFPTVGGAIDTAVVTPREVRFLEHKELSC